MPYEWTVEKLRKELLKYPQNYEVVMEIDGLESPLDEVDLDTGGEDKLILRY